MAEQTALVLARNIRSRRTELDMSQQRLAARMVAAGCAGWTSSTVAGVERVDRPPRALSVDELGALCMVLGVTLVQLLEGSPEVAEQLSGATQEPTGTDWAAAVRSAEEEEVLYALIYRLADSLGVDVPTVKRVALDLYGHDVLTERNRRLSEQEPAADARGRAQRIGHITRELRGDLAAYLSEEEPGQP